MSEKLIENIEKYDKRGFLTRKEIQELTGGLLKKQFLTNLDSNKSRQGIKGKKKVGREVIYPTNEVCSFIRERYFK